MVEVTAAGSDQAELRRLLRELGSEVAHVEPPNIDSASVGLDASVIVELVSTVPAFLTAIAALWTARSASQKRELKSIVLETKSGEVSLGPDTFGRDSAQSAQLPDVQSIRRIRLETG